MSGNVVYRVRKSAHGGGGLDVSVSNIHRTFTGEAGAHLTYEFKTLISFKVQNVMCIM